jgi:hypothetical protein
VGRSTMRILLLAYAFSSGHADSDTGLYASSPFTVRTISK